MPTVVKWSYGNQTQLHGAKLGRVSSRYDGQAHVANAGLEMEEDLGSGDCTSMSSVPESLVHEGFILAKESGVVAGIEVAQEVFHRVDPNVQFEAVVGDGDSVDLGDVVIRLHGAARSILAAERLALNFMQRMSGVATTTRQYGHS